MSSGLSQGNAFAFVRKDVTVSNSAGRLLDGVLVYFGYPQAREDDAERAVRAGLELIAAVSDLKTHAPLQTRVGIATGLVVVGDLIGSGRRPA
jgi:class 3 adenylate cyclase